MRFRCPPRHGRHRLRDCHHVIPAEPELHIDFLLGHELKDMPFWAEGTLDGDAAILTTEECLRCPMYRSDCVQRLRVRDDAQHGLHALLHHRLSDVRLHKVLTGPLFRNLFPLLQHLTRVAREVAVNAPRAGVAQPNPVFDGAPLSRRLIRVKPRTTFGSSADVSCDADAHGLGRSPCWPHRAISTTRVRADVPHALSELLARRRAEIISSCSSHSPLPNGSA